jgi:hypothetical protein
MGIFYFVWTSRAALARRFKLSDNRMAAFERCRQSSLATWRPIK